MDLINERAGIMLKKNIHIIIGLAIIAVFWVIPPIGSINEVGMRCVGIFLGMVYLWSIVDIGWPSLLGLILLGCSGFADFTTVFTTAFGNNTVLQCMFVLILFGALDEYGCSQYIAQWFVTRKIFKGRPYVFIGMYYLACWALSLISAIMALLMLWPIGVSIVQSLKVTREDRIWKYFFMGMYLIITIGQITLPFYGVPLMVTDAFETMSQGAYTLSDLSWIIYEVVMVALVLVGYVLVLKFIIRPDVSKLAQADPDKIRKDLNLPKMNKQQKAYLIMVPCYFAALLMPLFLPKDTPFIGLLSNLGASGFALLGIVVFSLLKFNGEPMLNLPVVAFKKMSWGLIFLIASAVYVANAISNPDLGIIKFITDGLEPILANCPEYLFVALLLLIILVATNFANNAAMILVLMPIILAFTPVYSINPIPIVMVISSLAFVAILTPSASPHASLLWGMKNIYSSKDIMQIGFVICIVILLVNLFIGYPLAKMIF